MLSKMKQWLKICLAAAAAICMVFGIMPEAAFSEETNTMKLPVKIYEFLEGEGGEDWYLSQHLELDSYFTADDPNAVLKKPRNDDIFWADGVTMDYEKQYIESFGWEAQAMDEGYSVDCMVWVDGLCDSPVTGKLTIPVPEGCDPATAKYTTYGSKDYKPVSSYTENSVTFPYSYDPELEYVPKSARYAVVEFVKSQTDKPAQETGSYKVLEGNNKTWTKGSEDGIIVRVDGEFEKFKSIKVDGKAVDSADYTAKSGSTIITLSSKYLGTLSNGAHDLTVVYDDGEVTAHFSVNADEAQKNPAPATNDSTFMAAWVIAAVFCIIAIICLGKKYFYSKR